MFRRVAVAVVALSLFGLAWVVVPEPQPDRRDVGGRAVVHVADVPPPEHDDVAEPAVALEIVARDVLLTPDGPVDSSLAVLEPRIFAAFKLHGAHLLATVRSIRAVRGPPLEASLAGKPLLIDVLGYDDERVTMRVRWNRALLDTTVHVHWGRVFAIGGPRDGDGVHLLVLGPTDPARAWPDEGVDASR